MNLNCRDCDEQLKKERGCEERSLIPFYIGNEVYRRCPVSMVSNGSWEYIKAYGFYRSGYLPQGNGWLNETSKYLDAMILIENEVAKIQNEQAKKAGKHGNKSSS